jgi:hypothetical protein
LGLTGWNKAGILKLLCYSNTFLEKQFKILLFSEIFISISLFLSFGCPFDVAHPNITRTLHCVVQIIPFLQQRVNAVMNFRHVSGIGSKKLSLCKNSTTGVMFFFNSLALMHKNIQFF